MRDWRDEENDRRMDEMYANRQGGDGGNDIVEFVTWIVIGFVVLLVITGFLDNQFGWGLTPALWNAIYEWSNGAIGKPSG